MNMDPMIIILLCVAGFFYWAYRHGKLAGYVQKVKDDAARLTALAPAKPVASAPTTATSLLAKLLERAPPKTVVAESGERVAIPEDPNMVAARAAFLANQSPLMVYATVTKNGTDLQGHTEAYWMTLVGLMATQLKR
jgi:hypothetical protein